MRKSETTNVFTDGLVMDLNPIVTPNNVVTNALNATLITMNGNENALQNDMGNGRVETAYLPEGYVPIGTAELGGIIYIVSYNPLIDKCQIGSFPSPERNITSSELANLPDIMVSNSDFQDSQGGSFNGNLKTYLLKVNLLDSEYLPNIEQLNPGDKYAIFCTDNGITNNKDYISDVGNAKDQLQVDFNPRNVTIHVVSIGDDGRITYLDDSLKWTPCRDGNGYYYIKEISGSELQQSDVDEYRSLIGSAYNTFTSKVSGTLALLLELKVIDSFSLTWDAEVTDIDNGDYNKEARIMFEMNWTSSYSVINPKYAILEQSNYSDPLAAANGGNMVEPGAFCTFDVGDDRYNDGRMEESVLATVGNFRYDSNAVLQEYIWKYEVVPAMSFGKIPYLAKSGSINFLDIGSGKIDLVEWRYYIQESNFYLNAGFDIYPEKNKQVDNITFHFIPFYRVKEFAQEFAPSYSEYIYDNHESVPKYVITDRTSYAGNYQELINFGEYSRITGGTIEKNMLYLVNITVQYGNSTNVEWRNHYRWLYTTTQWNQEYIDGELLDFKELTLDDVLVYDQNWEIVDNINKQIGIYYSENSLPESISVDPTYDMFGAMVTGVNYNKDEKSFNSNTESYQVSTEPIITSYPELFKFNQLDSDVYDFQIESDGLRTDGLSVTQEQLSSLADLVLPIIKEPEEDGCIDLDPTLPTIIDGVLIDGINDESENLSAKDQLESTLIQSGDAKFSVNVRGALFSRIAATLASSNVTVRQTLYPFIYNNSDVTQLNFTLSGSTVDVIEYFREDHRDLNKGGDGFTFSFTSIVNGEDRNTTDKNDFQNESDLRMDFWWSTNGANIDSDIKFYLDGLLPMMNKRQGSLKLMYTNGDGDNRTMFTSKFNENYTGNNMHRYYYVWIKTDENHYVPINCFNRNKQTLAKLLFSLYSSLYYVDTKQIELMLPIVSNIVYVTNYREIYDLVISPIINIAEESLDEHILVTEEIDGQVTNSVDLKTLQSYFSEEQREFIVLNNIDTTKEIEFSDRTLSHTFSLINENLYRIFLDAKNTTLSGIAYNVSQPGFTRYESAKDADYLYVYNSALEDYQRLSSGNGTYVYPGFTSVRQEDGRVYVDHTGITPFGDTELFDYLEYKDGEMVAQENNILIDLYSLYFHTGAKGGGNAGLMIDGNSNLNLGTNYVFPGNNN